MFVGLGTAICIAFAAPESLSAQQRTAFSMKRADCVSCSAIPAAVSLGAGMLGGAIGVGVAYPLDTLKTKAQAIAGRDMSSNPFELAMGIVRSEGIAGFYSGVTSTMAGQAMIKGTVFFTYEAAKSWCATTALGTSFIAMSVAACFSGGVGSLIVTPVERIKCVMQAREAGTYTSPLACISDIVERDGLPGFLLRGLGATLLREVPAYALYFVSYDLIKAVLLTQAALSASLVSLVGGAFAGAMSWIPVYPIDVIKTQVQVSVDGGDDSDTSFIGTARRLVETGGVAVFWDGLGPKLARAVVNHAVTFWVFDWACTLAMR
mmetsp:Transcript_50520/g.131442  ORF Transcript_50520/g.131442 Transcript_50520/m.131442 type:complete len:320 (-) Transcript_50520:79-1038(-)